MTGDAGTIGKFGPQKISSREQGIDSRRFESTNRQANAIGRRTINSPGRGNQMAGGTRRGVDFRPRTP